jgi:hypothetical protein
MFLTAKKINGTSTLPLSRVIILFPESSDYSGGELSTVLSLQADHRACETSLFETII